MADPLDVLAETAGIEPDYHDIWGNLIVATAEQKRRMLEAMGIAAADAKQQRASLAALEARRWSRLVDPVAVIAAESQPGHVTLCVEAGSSRALRWSLTEEGGTVRQGRTAAADLPVVERRDQDGLVRLQLSLPAGLPEGYHALRVRHDGGSKPSLGDCRLIVAPRRCWGPDEAVGADRVWGLGCQLYSLRSARNWGLGTFADLATLAGRAATEGAELIGLNPLHALYPADPGQCSPYSPSSRDFLNILYIDIDAIPEFAASETAARMIAESGFRSRLAAARSSEQVDYPTVAGLLLPVLEAVFDSFDANAGPDRRAAFAAFRSEMGPSLRRFALFMALQEHFVTGGGPPMLDWRRWPEPFRRLDSAEIAMFSAAHDRRVRFHEFLQWVADGQLASAAKAAEAAGMRIGLYRDLAVGVGPGSATAWAEGDALLPGASIGAPPDLLNRVGQDWGLAPLNPEALRDVAYWPFIAAVRANMRHAGALRIDHAMGLMHQYWVPRGLKADQGTYVTYPLQNLLRILALESRRQRCLVIGEDLGTVPAGFRETMAEAGLLSYRVLPFERTDGGLFARPETYPEAALVTGSTHDLATLRGLWAGRDLHWRRILSLYPDRQVRDTDACERIADRRRLIDALIDTGLWPAHPPVDPESLTFDTRLMIAIQRFLAITPSRLLMVPLEDALEMEEQMNLPGTIEEHPNWRRKLPVELEEMFEDPGIVELLEALRRERAAAESR